MTIATLINKAAAQNTTFSVAQASNAIYNAFPFGDSFAIEKALIDAGHSVQQNSGSEMLVDHKVWVRTNGIIYPVITTNL